MKVSALVKNVQSPPRVAGYGADDVQKMAVDLLRAEKPLGQFMGTLRAVQKRLDAGKGDFGPFESKINDVIGLYRRYEVLSKDLRKFREKTMGGIVKYLKKVEE